MGQRDCERDDIALRFVHVNSAFKISDAMRRDRTEKNKREGKFGKEKKKGCVVFGASVN